MRFGEALRRHADEGFGGFPASHWPDIRSTSEATTRRDEIQREDLYRSMILLIVEMNVPDLADIPKPGLEPGEIVQAAEQPAQAGARKRSSNEREIRQYWVDSGRSLPAILAGKNELIEALKEIVDNVLDERDELKSTVVAAKAELHSTKKNLAQLFRLVGTIVELLAKFGPQNVTPVLVSLVQFHIVSPVKPSFM